MRDVPAAPRRGFALLLCVAALLGPPRATAEDGGIIFIDYGFGFQAAEETQPQQDSSILFSDGTSDASFGVDVAPDDAAPAAAAPPLLVNEQYPVGEDYVPDELVLMEAYCDPAVVKMKGSKIEGSRVAVDALLRMLGDAIDQGVTRWQVSSGYRSVQYQQEMWDNRVYRYRKEDGMSGAQARAATARYMARPGASEHHTGLAFDITVPGEDSFSSTKQCKWLHENCWDYGFIIRYTAEKKDITGINAEPWHIRYVGLPHSLAMKESGECLEEYLGMVGEP